MKEISPSKGNRDQPGPASVGSRSTAGSPLIQSNHPLQRIYAFQRTIGNRTVDRLIQSKLAVNRTGDRFEKEADQVANQVVRMAGSQPAQEEIAEDAQAAIRLKSLVQGGAEMPPEPPSSSLPAASGGAQSLPTSVRAFFEPRFGMDFSHVRIHNNARSADLARSLRARAYTIGQDIVFGAGEFAPETSQGKHLLAHELTHVIQQSGSGSAFPVQGNIPYIHPSPTVFIQRKDGEPAEELIPSGGTEINAIGIVQTSDGANLRDAPDSDRTPISLLPFNTTVSVIKSFPNGWYFVSGLEPNQTGYVAANRIKTDLPEPNAKLHRIAPGETAQEIARQYYGVDAEPGRDERYYVNVLVYINKGEGDPSKGIYREHKEGEEAEEDWAETRTRANYLIWIPSRGFAKTLVGTVKSGSITGGLKAAVSGLFNRLGDIKDAIVLSVSYLPGAIYAHFTEAIKEVLVSLAVLLVGAIGILAVTTALGALIGALAGGAGAAPGAAVGFKVGMFIIKWLGVALLLYWVGSKLLEIAGAFAGFLGTAWNARGDRTVIDTAARQFADAVGLLIAFLMQAIIFYAIQLGSARALGRLGETRFGKWIGSTKLGKWLSERLARVERDVPESAKGQKFGSSTDGYKAQGIFNAWVKSPDPIPPEGWKMHVSANPGSASRIAEIVLPLLRSHKVNHKVVQSPELLAAMGSKPGSTQAGKFITIYPKDPAQAKSVAGALESALAGQSLKGPAISGEKPIGNTGLIYGRYGGFTKETVTNPSGQEVPDVRGRYKPPWIKEDPFSGRPPAPKIGSVPGGGEEKELE